MKPFRLFAVLVFCLFLTSSFAIRIPQDPKEVKLEANNDVRTASEINGGDEACKDKEDCSSTLSGKFRKLMITPNSAPTTTSKSLHKGANRKTEKPGSSFESESVPRSSQDMEYGDITEMDYSPAKRKPPIHN